MKVQLAGVLFQAYSPSHYQLLPARPDIATVHIRYDGTKWRIDYRPVDGPVISRPFTSRDDAVQLDRFEDANMNPHFSDPEAHQILNERKTARDNEWLKGQVGEATYLRSLMILGYTLRDARTELHLLEMSK